MARLDPSSRPPAAAGTRDLGPVRLVAVVFLLVLPAQVLGVLVGGTLLEATGLLREHPGLSNLITVTAGATAGLALGLLLRPAARLRGRYLAVAAVVSVVVVVLLLVLANLRSPAGTVDAPWTAYLLGPALLVAAQTLLAWALWRARGNR